MPRPRKLVDYAPELQPGDFGRLMARVRDAFQALQRGPDVEERIANLAIKSAIHNIPFGLSRATAHPPSCFRLADRPVETKRGRPLAIEALFVAVECRQLYERITGKRATVITDPEKKKPYGAYYDLVRAVLAALGIKDNPETAARGATDNHTVRAHRRRNAGAFSP